MSAKQDVVLLHSLDLKEVYHRTGIHSRSGNYPAAHFTGPVSDGTEDFVLVLSWSGEWTFLTVEVAKNDRSLSTSERTFSNKLAVARDLLQKYGIAPDQLGRDYEEFKGKAKKRFLLGEIGKDTELTLNVTVDTDSPDFLHTCQQSGTRSGDGLPLEILIVTYPKPTGNVGRSDPALRKLTINLMPAQAMPRLEGFVALDVGNTHSTMVYLPANSDNVHEIEVVDAEGKDVPGPVMTAVELTAYPPGEYGQAQTYLRPEWAIGTEALLERRGWLILGVLRLLTNPNAMPLEIYLGGRKLGIDKRLPAELFITSMIKQLCQQKRRYPSQLAITHPSTFSNREADALREVVYYAWRRTMGAEAYKVDWEKLEKLIPVVLDEASAAVIYFLYRDFAQTPGGLNGFHYLYPSGMNLLLCNCGADTTNFHLVHAQMRPGAGGKRVLGVEVKGRTGLRGFGGDDITAAIFKIIKAQLAAQISNTVSGKTRLIYPKNSWTDLPAWLKSNRAALDSLVPTRFNPENVDQVSVREPMRATRELWMWAEEFKKKLGTESPHGKREFLHESELITLLLKKFPSLKIEQCRNFFKNIEVHREEVDELIRPLVNQSIDNANRMIAERLPTDAEVNWVYVVGNASLYPFVRETIQDRLHVRFLKEGERMRFDKDELTIPVAKGAVLALGLYAKCGGVGMEFDNSLKDRLPYHILFRDLNTGGHRILFQEHERYDQLGEKSIPVPPPDEEADQRGEQRNRRTEVFLRRQWPGDEKPSRFLYFQFDRPVDGPLKVRYQCDPPRFIMSDEGRSGQQNVEGKEMVDASYCSLMQQGDL